MSSIAYFQKNYKTQYETHKYAIHDAVREKGTPEFQTLCKITALGACEGALDQIQVLRKKVIQKENHKLLTPEQVQLALHDQGQRVKLAYDKYEAQASRAPYKNFKFAPWEGTRLAKGDDWEENDSIDSFKSESILGLAFEVGTCRAQGRRSYMQDRVFIDDLTNQDKTISLPFFGVLDGHGDDAMARYVEMNLLDQLRRHFNCFSIQGSDTEADDTIYNSLKHSPIALHEAYKKKGGTTANICLIANKHIYAANVGDSRAILVNLGNGTVKLLSEDAKPDDPRHKRIIEALGGTVDFDGQTWRVSGNIGMGSALGDIRTPGINPTVDITKTPIEDGSDQLLVIASDGVWDVVTPNKLGEALATRMKEESRTSMQEIAEDIVGSCFLNRSQDNLSAVAVKIPRIQEEAP